MKTVIVGGTSGIGLATAQLLAKEGMEVTVTGRDPERLAAVPEPIATERMDVTDRRQVIDFFEAVGPIDHLVLAASPGSVGAGPLGETAIEDVATAVIGKAVAYLHATQQARVSGSVTMVSAASARAAMAGTVALAAANGAIERAVSPLAAELAPVRVNAVSPGVIDTPWWSSLAEEDRQAQFASFGGSFPAGRVGAAEDVARAIAYLISADYVTGSILPVDGGATVA